MKKIKVYLQFPWKFPDSSYYKYLVEKPPKNIDYVNIKKKSLGVISKRKFLLSNFIKKMIRKILYMLSLPIPNAHFTRSKHKYNLIHCTHCLSSNKKPWIADFEGFWQMWISGKPTKLGKKRVKNILLDENCKKILPWTNTTKNDILKLFPEKEIRKKLEIIYPAVPLPKIKRKKHKKVTLIYASRYFWIKGGLIALKVFSRLKKKYNIEEFFISDVPKDLREKYKNINITGLVSHKKLINDYFPKSDIFFYPSLVDTFGFALLESMSFALPVVAVNTKYTKSRKEIIQNNKTGFTIDVSGNVDYYKIGKKEEKIIKDLVKKMSVLIEDKKLREKMGKEGFKQVSKGKFSIKERNKKLKRIYEEALK